MRKTTISILGCGWLGLPLAQRLVQLGFEVKGSTTTPAKIPVLRQISISPFLIRAAPSLEHEAASAFFDSEILFLNIPFHRSLKDPRIYKQQIDSVVERVESSAIHWVIFAGSTSVYPASLACALEDTAIAPDSPRSEVLYALEQSLLKNRKFAATVIRFAGLYGGTRQIGRMMAGKIDADNGQSPVNLIHLEDCIDVVIRIIEMNARGEIFNACSDGHPTKREIYTKAAIARGLTPPLFVDNPRTGFKIVSNTKLKTKLNYTFKHPDPSDL